jgi:hypothetical protein
VGIEIGSQNAGIINNVAGDQWVAGGQHGLAGPAGPARQAVRDLGQALAATPLEATAAAQANLQVAAMAAMLDQPQPDRPRLAGLLERLTRLLASAGSLVTSGAALVGPLRTLAEWLGALGVPVLHLLAL